MAKKLKKTLGPLAAARRRQQQAWMVAALAVAAFVTVAVAPEPRLAAAQPPVVPSTQ